MAFAYGQARRTEFAIQHISGTSQYAPAFGKKLEDDRREERQERREEERKRQEAPFRAEYQVWCEEELVRQFEALPEAERQAYQEQIAKNLKQSLRFVLQKFVSVEEGVKEGNWMAKECKFMQDNPIRAAQNKFAERVRHDLPDIYVWAKDHGKPLAPLPDVE